MSTETDRVIASIDRALTSDEITDLVDEQLARYDQRTGYDYSVGQPRCGHCGGDEHHLAITERIEEMRDWGLYDETYRYDEDTSRIVCPGTQVPGPVGFRRAHVREQRAQTRAEARRDFDRRLAERRAEVEAELRASGYTDIGSTADGGNVLIRPYDASYSEGGLIPRGNSGDLTVYDEAWEAILTPAPRELLRELISAAVQAFGSLTGETLQASLAMDWARGGPVQHPAAPTVPPAGLTVRLFTESGQPVRLGRKARVVSYEQTVTGFIVEVDATRLSRSFGVPHRILLDGPGGPRERIAGIVTELSSPPGGPIRIEAASEHRRLPTVYTEPTEH